MDIRDTISYNQSIEVEGIPIHVRVNISLVTDLQYLTETTALCLLPIRLTELRHEKTNYEDILQKLRLQGKWTEQRYEEVKFRYNEILRAIWTTQVAPILRERQSAIAKERLAQAASRREQEKRDKIWQQEVERRWQEHLVQNGVNWLPEAKTRWELLEQNKQKHIDNLWCDELKKKIQGRKWTNEECEWFINKAIKGEELGVLETLLTAKPPLWGDVIERLSAYEALTTQVRNEIKQNWVVELFRSEDARIQWEAEQQYLAEQQTIERKKRDEKQQRRKALLRRRKASFHKSFSEATPIKCSISRFRRHDNNQKARPLKSIDQRRLEEEAKTEQLRLETEQREQKEREHQKEQEWQLKARRNAELKAKAELKARQEAAERRRAAQAISPMHQQPKSSSPSAKELAGTGCIVLIIGVFAVIAFLPALIKILAALGRLAL